MDDIKRVRHPHAVRMEDRKKAQFTGITDVVSFEPSKVILESLHVNKLSVEKGELDVDGRVDSLVYSQNSISMKKGDSLVNRLFR